MMVDTRPLSEQQHCEIVDLRNEVDRLREVIQEAIDDYGSSREPHNIIYDLKQALEEK